MCSWYTKQSHKSNYLKPDMSELWGRPIATSTFWILCKIMSGLGVICVCLHMLTWCPEGYNITESTGSAALVCWLVCMHTKRCTLTHLCLLCCQPAPASCGPSELELALGTRALGWYLRTELGCSGTELCLVNYLWVQVRINFSIFMGRLVTMNSKWMKHF